MIDDSTDATSADDVVRCFYLARVAQRLGHADAARRWLKKADPWLQATGLKVWESIGQTKVQSGIDCQ